MSAKQKSQCSLSLANYHFQTGDYSQANQWFTQAEQRVVGNPEHLLAWIKLQFGIIDLSRGRLGEALAHYNESLAIFHDYWLAQEHIAGINAMQGRLTLAEENYTLRPAGDSALLLIQALALSDQLPQAMVLLESTLQTSFKTADFYATASVLYEASQQHADAASYTRGAIAMNPLAINDISWLKERINW